MSLSVLMNLHKDKYQSLQAAKWLKKNLNKSLKTLIVGGNKPCLIKALFIIIAT